MEQGLIPPDPMTAPPAGSLAIDGRGWVTALVAMVLIGLWTFRAPPGPSEPRRIPTAMSEPWMADALPGVGIKTRDEQWRKVRAGTIDALPERARGMARVVFTWPDQHPPRSSSPLPTP